MRDFASNPEATSLIPCSCMCVKSSLPHASTKVTLLRSTKIDSGDSVGAVARQHLSSSLTQAPASLPSTTRRVAPESMQVVILSTADSFPPDAVSNWLAILQRPSVAKIAADQQEVRDVQVTVSCHLPTYGHRARAVGSCSKIFGQVFSMRS